MNRFSASPARGTNARAFTLIELLIVVTILVILPGMALPMMSIIRLQTLRSRTNFVLRKVDTAVRLFKTDWQVYPYQASYADLSLGPFVNHLGYRIGTDIADVDRAAVTANMAKAESKFYYNRANNTEGAQPAPGIDYTVNIVTQANDGNNSIAMQVATLLNRMGQEQAGAAMLAGNIGMKGAVISDTNGVVKLNQSAITVMSAADLTTGTPGIDPGMATDYLKGDLDKSYFNGDTIIDAWHNPLVYICQMTPGIRGTPMVCDSQYTAYSTTGCFDSRQYGLGPSGFDPSTGPSASLCSANRAWLLYGGRVRLSNSDAGDGQSTPSDISYFPTANLLMHSDVRYYAAPGYESEFELWSSGPDGKFSYLRDDAVNTDNLSAQPYNKVLNND